MKPEGALAGNQQNANEHETEIESRADFLLRRLGLRWEYLEGKRILDIGAGDAELEQAAKKRNITIIPIDPRSTDVYQTSSPRGVDYIQGSAFHLPFQNNSFDLVLSHAAPPTMFIKDAEQVRIVLEEMERILKDGGEARFGPLLS